MYKVAPQGIGSERGPPRQVSASRRSLCQRHKHIGQPTASSPRWHRRRSEPWLLTLPTPWGRTEVTAQRKAPQR